MRDATKWQSWWAMASSFQESVEEIAVSNLLCRAITRAISVVLIVIGAAWTVAVVLYLAGLAVAIGGVPHL